jgi:tetratricopeptide (TPR) repeat protein
LNSVIFRIAVGFLLGVLILLAGSLSFSSYYLKQQQKLAAAGDVGAALDAAQLSARLDPFNSAPVAAQSFLLQGQGNPEEAAEVLREAIRRDPANYGNRAQLGTLQFTQLNDPGAAVETYRKALEQNPKDTVMIANLAAALASTGDLEGAKREYEKCKEFDRILTRDLYDLGRIYARTGEPEKAVETLEEARERAGNGLESLKGQKRASRELFINSVDLAIADAYVAQGNYDEATRVLENSDAEQAPAILELLYINPEEYRESVLNSEL